MGRKNGLTLIGMPASGKSTVGVLLAKTLGFSFVDTDLIIQKNTSALLQDIIDREGISKFLQFEEEALLSLSDFEKTVTATGGSAVFSEKGMNHLSENSLMIYLKASPDIIKSRLTNIRTRGIAAEKGQTIDDIYKQRSFLYEKYARISVSADGASAENIVENIIKALAAENIIMI